MSMTRTEFQRLAVEGYTHIPLSREVLADFDTPLSTYLKLADAPFSYLLESVHGGEKWGRYSIIGLPCETQLRVRHRRVETIHRGVVTESMETSDPLEVVRQMQRAYRVPEVRGLPRFSGGLVGYFSYDVAGFIEDRLNVFAKKDSTGVPDLLLMVSDEIVVFDNLSGRVHLIVHVATDEENAWEQGQRRLSELVECLNQTSFERPRPRQPLDIREQDFISHTARSAFEQAVRRCKEYIYEGDIFQVVLSQRMSVDYEADPLDLYRALRTLNPSPYMYYLQLDAFQIVGSSPEILTRLDDGMITVRPIAGTRRRGIDEAEDLRLEKELMADPKELAEHLMLVDLGRNDVGRVAKTGSVRLTEKMQIERYSHVMHIVSNVVGELNAGLDAIDLLKSTFPAGTLSGAPKIRAMEIIDELEPEKRGVYGGAVGYIGWNGNMDMAIAIRTALITQGKLYVQAGAGIVADSDPSAEWQETLSKARAVKRAVTLAARGLDQGID